MQASINKAHLKPYLKTVKGRIAKNAHSPAWGTLEGRWRDLADHSRGIIAAYRAGKVSRRHERHAAEQIVKLADDVEPRRIVETVAAVVLMQETEPRRFRSDVAFWMQLTRLVRSLTDINYGERYIHTTGKVKRCYRELSPRASVIMGRWLSETLGLAGLHIARLVQADADKKAKERQDLHKALAELV